MRRCRRWSGALCGTFASDANPAQGNPNSMPDEWRVLQIPPQGSTFPAEDHQMRLANDSYDRLAVCFSSSNS